jgi:hypothetical protein
MKKIWRFLSNRHLTPQMDELEFINAKILNQYSYALSFAAIIHSLADLIILNSPRFYVMAIAGVYIFLSTFYTRIRFKRFHSLIFCICLALFLFYYSYQNEFNNSITLYYIVLLSAIPLAAYNPIDRFKFVPVIFIIVATLLVLNNSIYFRLYPSGSDFVKVKLRYFVIFHSLLFTGISIYFIISKERMLIMQYNKSKRADMLIADLKSKLTTENPGNAKPTIEQVINLAMDDDITFVPTFKLLFTDMYDKLMTVNPKITTSEFKFCALLKLGFSTKDISMYNNVTVRSVQTRKSRLRKSFNVPAETDLYNWIEEI